MNNKNNIKTGDQDSTLTVFLTFLRLGLTSFGGVWRGTSRAGAAVHIRGLPRICDEYPAEWNHRGIDLPAGDFRLVIFTGDRGAALLGFIAPHWRRTKRVAGR
jgi:hypothetical protein